MNCGLAGGLDKTEVSYCNATYVIAATTKILGYDQKNTLCDGINSPKKEQITKEIAECLRRSLKQLQG